jgi:hypothetical protein
MRIRGGGGGRKYLMEEKLLMPTDKSCGYIPMRIHAPSYDQWFRRYALSKLMNAARILCWTDWRKLTILNFDQDSK